MKPLTRGQSSTEPKGRWRQLVELAKFFYSNDFTRGIGRDVTMFGVSVVVIRVIMSALAEEMPPAAAATGPLPPLPGAMGR